MRRRGRASAKGARLRKARALCDLVYVTFPEITREHRTQVRGWPGREGDGARRRAPSEGEESGWEADACKGPRGRTKCGRIVHSQTPSGRLCDATFTAIKNTTRRDCF